MRVAQDGHRPQDEDEVEKREDHSPLLKFFKVRGGRGGGGSSWVRGCPRPSAYAPDFRVVHYSNNLDITADPPEEDSSLVQSSCLEIMRSGDYQHCASSQKVLVIPI